MSEQPDQPKTAPESAPKKPVSEFFEHQVKAAQETVKAFQALLPPEFREHSRTARHEFLLSFKVLLEGAMSTVEHELNKVRQPAGNTGGDDNGPSTTGKSKVKVEVN